MFIINEKIVSKNIHPVTFLWFSLSIFIQHLLTVFELVGLGRKKRNRKKTDVMFKRIVNVFQNRALIPWFRSESVLMLDEKWKDMIGARRREQLQSLTHKPA